MVGASPVINIVLAVHEIETNYENLTGEGKKGKRKETSYASARLIGTSLKRNQSPVRVKSFGVTDALIQ